MTKQPFPSDQQDKFMLRLPDGMRDRIRKAAEANRRSLNAEIVAVLEEKFPKRVEELLVFQLMSKVSFDILQAPESRRAQAIEDGHSLLLGSGFDIRPVYIGGKVTFDIGDSSFKPNDPCGK